MQSQEPSSSLSQPRKLPFFPASFCDETLFSRVSRYHLLTGKRQDETSFLTLFGKEGNSVDFSELAPPSLTVLAALLPGDPMVQLGSLLKENTFVPFAIPVARSLVEEFIGTEFGTSKACLQCLKDDEATVGVAYLRRSHQLPAVTACWKHGTSLIDACPDCGNYFWRPRKFLTTPVTICGCGWHAGDGRNAVPASKAEHEFAIHAYCVLEQRVSRTSLAVAVRFFQSQIEQSVYKIEPLGHVNRRLLVGLIGQQMAEGRTTTEIVTTAATVMASTRKAHWWVTSVSTDLMKQRSTRRQHSD